MTLGLFLWLSTILFWTMFVSGLAIVAWGMKHAPVVEFDDAGRRSADELPPGSRLNGGHPAAAGWGGSGGHKIIEGSRRGRP
jgi:hypothetical protein